MARVCDDTVGTMLIVRRLKALARRLLGRDIRVSVDLECAAQRFGSAYGGWEVATQGLDQGAVVYSFGVGEDASFDLALIERYQLCVHAFDPTPKSIAWVGCQGLPANFVLHEYGLAAIDGELQFNPPENPDHVSHTVLDRPATRERAISVPVRRLQTIMGELGHPHIDILKMDIEGAEYAVLQDMHDADIRPRQIRVEFHHRFPGVGVKKSKDAIRLLRAMGYGLFAVSASKEEYSFIHLAGIGRG